jgi:5-methylcytosine-specific restriction protein A
MAKPHERHWRTWYNTAAWRRRRAFQLQVQPLCELCLKQNKITPASIVDHHPPHGGDWTKFRTGAVRSLCKPCHDGAVQYEAHHGFDNAIDASGYPIDRAHPAYGNDR